MEKGLHIVLNKPLLYYPDLSVGDVQNSNLLSFSEKEVLLASLNNEKLRNIDLLRDSAPYKTLVEIIAKTIWESGISTMGEAEMQMFVPIAIQEIKNEHEYLTIEDVRLALKNGVRKKYGEYYGMNITTLSVWLEAYTNQTKRDSMLRLPFIKKQEVPKEQTEQQKKEFHRVWLNSVYEHFNNFKNTNVFDFVDFNNSFYKYCKKLNLINLSGDEQQEIWDLAVKELKAQYQNSNERSYGKRIDRKNILESLKIGENDKTLNELIIIKSKKIAVHRFFERLISEGINLKELIESRIKINE